MKVAKCFIEGGTITRYSTVKFISERVLEMSPLFLLLKYGLLM